MAQIGVEPAVPLSRVESRWQQKPAFRRGSRAFRRGSRATAIEHPPDVTTGLRATTSGRQQLRPPRGCAEQRRTARSRDRYGRRGAAASEVGAEQRGTVRSRGRYGRRGAAASGVGANSGELP